jgi:hypothetical protein
MAMSEKLTGALRWLRGADNPHTERVFDALGQPTTQLISEPQGLLNLIEILKSSEPVPMQLRMALANALNPVGSSESCLSLTRQKRRRGRPRKSIKGAIEQLNLAKDFDEFHRGSRFLTDVDIGEFSKLKEVRKSKATIYKAKASQKLSKEARQKIDD